jgi:hypothetical protein
MQQRRNSGPVAHLCLPVIGEATGDLDDFSQMGEPGGLEEDPGSDSTDDSDVEK